MECKDVKYQTIDFVKTGENGFFEF